MQRDEDSRGHDHDICAALILLVLVELVVVQLKLIEHKKDCVQQKVQNTTDQREDHNHVAFLTQGENELEDHRKENHQRKGRYRTLNHESSLVSHHFRYLNDRKKRCKSAHKRKGNEVVVERIIALLAYRPIRRLLMR